MAKSIGRADVAKAAGVSESTVSRALNDSPLISGDIKRKVRKQENCIAGRTNDFVGWATQKGLELIENYLQKYPKIHAVYCQDDDVMTGVLQAIKESGRMDIKLVFGGAGQKATYEKIIVGDPLVKATATYHPSMVYDAINYCLDVAEGKKSSDFHTAKTPTSVVLPSVLVDKSTVMDHYDKDSVFQKLFTEMYCTPKKFGGAILGGGWLLMNVLFMNIHETKRCYLYYADKKMQEYTFNRE